MDNNYTKTQTTQWSCIEKIVKQFYCDTITLLDCVLSDCEEDPKYSAITTHQRLEDMRCYECYVGRSNAVDVFEFLKEKGYSDADIDDFQKKMRVEAPLWNRPLNS